MSTRSRISELRDGRAIASLVLAVALSLATAACAPAPGTAKRRQVE